MKRERASELSVARRAEAHAHFGAGIVREMSNDPAGALQEYSQAAALDPGDEELILDVTRRLQQARQPEKALELTQRAAQQPGASGQIYARLGQIYSQMGKADLAMAANREAIKRSPDQLIGYQNLCLNFLAAKQPRQALNVLDDAARQRKPDGDFLIGLGELYATVGLQAPAEKAAANPKALAILDRAAKLAPATPMFNLKLADGYHLLGESAKAAQYYLEVLKRPPEVPLVEERARANLASLYLRGSEHKPAIEQLEAILRNDPTNPQAHYYLGRLQLEEKKPAEAADHLGKAILLSPGLEAAYFFLALAELENNKPAEALATLDKGRQKFQPSFALEYYTALAYSRQKGYAQAMRHFVAAEVIAKATDPSQLNEGFYFQLGSNCERKGDYDQAEKYFEKSLQLSPNFAEAQNYLGYMWAEHGVKLEKARELIEQAVKAEPKNAAFLDSLAWVHFKLNQPTAALPYALRSVELCDPPDATVYDHLGDIYAALKQFDQARDAWRKALALEPSDEIRKKLDSSTFN